jgi:hypothetical protein
MSGTDPASPQLTAAAGSVPVALDGSGARHRCGRLIFAAKFMHRSGVGSAALKGGDGGACVCALKEVRP